MGRRLVLVALLGCIAGCAHGGAAGARAGGATKAAAAPPKPAPPPKAAPKLTIEAPKAGQGVVHVECKPGDANVVVDGVTYGRASDFDRPPYLVLKPGEHKILLRKEGYETYRTEVYLSGSVIETLSVSLSPRPTAVEGPGRKAHP